MHDEEQRRESVLARSNSPNCSSKGQTFYLVCCEKFMNSLLNTHSFSVMFTSDLERVWHGHVQLFFSPLLFCLNGYVVQIYSLKGQIHIFCYSKSQKRVVAFETYNYRNYVLEACVSQNVSQKAKYFLALDK